MNISAAGLDFKEINDYIKVSNGVININGCLGQRYIGVGQTGKTIRINGIPGNALGAYLDGAEIEVYGNAQDAAGDTMNCGRIIIHGSAGDAVGYAMRGGDIYIRDNAGYRAGIHMKAYADKLPVIVIGGTCGSFLGEYQAGGIIIVLNIGCDDDATANFCATGMHGGKIFIRSSRFNKKLPGHVNVKKADAQSMKAIEPYIKNYSEFFNAKIPENEDFYVLTPNTQNPYKQLYIQN